ncbi:PaaI family thioesterase [Sporosarcina sp. ANT_H38]|uniref:PaaI family thioesterase n=1 Tax=Sporosarcina sp. ANT_H38 TaxID=2597358 RepID=UPI0021066FA4|nr:PaaI family thioesterase [Sporosarcina sp. ANT_H38]
MDGYDAAGTCCDLSDAAMGYAFASTLADDEAFTTLEIKLNFLKPIWKTKLRAVSKVIKKERILGYLNVMCMMQRKALSCTPRVHV